MTGPNTFQRIEAIQGLANNLPVADGYLLNRVEALRRELDGLETHVLSQRKVHALRVLDDPEPEPAA